VGGQKKRYPHQRGHTGHTKGKGTEEVLVAKTGGGKGRKIHVLDLFPGAEKKKKWSGGFAWADKVLARQPARKDEQKRETTG